MTGAGRDRGSSVIWVLACGALVLAVGAMVTVRTIAVVARHRVEAAADLAALAGADQLGDRGDPCGAAARVAARNGAELVLCVVRPVTDGTLGGTVAVSVRAQLRLGLVGPCEVEASARAGRVRPDPARARYGTVEADDFNGGRRQDDKGWQSGGTRGPGLRHQRASSGGAG